MWDEYSLQILTTGANISVRDSKVVGIKLQAPTAPRMASPHGSEVPLNRCPIGMNLHSLLA
jgi:hypothetical protein